MKRIRPVEEDTDGCHVCGAAHFCEDCPCFDMIPRVDLELGPKYDKVCIGCGRIGVICCSKGAYAVRKSCGGCGGYGHWYWEKCCSKDWRRPSYIAEVPSIEELKEEVMKKKNKAVVEEDEESDDEDNDGCGRIGVICCSKGAYAVRKSCGGCGGYGHWYWEKCCSKDWRRPSYIAEVPSIEELKEEVMKKKNKAVVEEDEESDDEDNDDCVVFYDYQRRRKKIRIPDPLQDKEEILRLMKRIPPSPPAVKKDMLDCAVCSDNHFSEDCPCFDRIPVDVVLRPEYDMICRGCGKIGEICCSKGAYAKFKRCGGCCRTGHWYWENKCPKDWCRPSHVVKIPSIQELEDEVEGTRVVGNPYAFQNTTTAV